MPSPRQSAVPQIEWLNAGKDDSLIYSVSDTSVLLAGDAGLKGHSIVFLKAGTEAAQASAIIDRLDQVSGLGDVAAWGGEAGINLEGKNLPYLIVNGAVGEVKELIERAELIPHPYKWAGIEQQPAAGHSFRQDKGHGGPRGPHFRGS